MSHSCSQAAAGLILLLTGDAEESKGSGPPWAPEEEGRGGGGGGGEGVWLNLAAANIKSILNEVVGFVSKEHLGWASLVAQWLRICLPMQGTRVRSLVWEDPTCHGAIGPASHNY